MSEKAYWRFSEVAELFCVDVGVIYDRAEEGSLKWVSFGPKSRRIPDSEVQRLRVEGIKYYSERKGAVK